MRLFEDSSGEAWRGERTRLQGWLWMLALSLLTLLFFLSYFNRFAGLRSGDGEYYTGMAFLQGHFPYRDYFSATPPLNTLKSAMLLKVFGPLLIVSRAAGAVERVVIALVLFKWLARLFALRYAFLASLITVIISAADRSDPLASYNHDALLFAMLSGYAASKVLAATGRRRFLLWSAAAGAFAGLCLLTKQTVGLGAVVVMPFAVAVIFVNRGAMRQGLRWIAGFCAGCAVPIVLFVAWLVRMRLLNDFVTMVFHQGPAAKAGHPADFLRRTALIAYQERFWVGFALIAMALSWLAIRDSERREDDSILDGSQRTVIWMSVAAGAVILLAMVFERRRFPLIFNSAQIAVYFVLLMSTLLVGVYLWTLLRGRLTPRQAQFCLLATVSFSNALLLSLSWPAFEAMLLPGLGLLVAAILDGTRPVSRRLIYLLLAGMLFLVVREKLEMPFAFGGLGEEPVRDATAASVQPELKGMRLPPGTRDFIDQTIAVVQANTTPTDTIFTYPEIALFYALTARTYPTLSGSHNVDVVNDKMALEESARLLRKPPAVIVYLAPTAQQFQQEDWIWRFGRPSGQHVLVDTVEELLPSYRLAGRFRAGPRSPEIGVYVRR